MNFIIDMVIYSCDIMFSIGQSDKAFKRVIKAKMPPEYYLDIKDDEIMSLSQECNGRTYHHLLGGQTIIRLPRLPETPQEYGTLSHEIFHAVEFIFRRVGIRLCEESDEAYAYAIGYVTKRFYEAISTNK